MLQEASYNPQSGTHLKDISADSKIDSERISWSDSIEDETRELAPTLGSETRCEDTPNNACDSRNWRNYHPEHPPRRALLAANHSPPLRLLL